MQFSRLCLKMKTQASILALSFFVTVSGWRFKLEIKDAERNETRAERIQRVLDSNPVIDGHNHFPETLQRVVGNNLTLVDLNSDLTRNPLFGTDNRSQTDLPRLRSGKVGGQFWVAFVPCDARDAVEKGLEQVDLIHRLTEQYPEQLKLVVSTSEIQEAVAEGRIASLIGVEGGHVINSNLAVLRSFYRAGVRYLTLAHTCNTPWIDSAQVELGVYPTGIYGLSQFGEHVILEMNRLGMMVDLSHTDTAAMRHGLRISRAPVIFSHAGARAVFDHPRNVPDDVLERVAANGGVLLVTLQPCYLGPGCNSDRGARHLVYHIDHIRRVAGVDHVGLGSDYDGMDRVPAGLEDVSRFPALFLVLLEHSEFSWTDEELEKLARRNLLRVFRRVEMVADRLRAEGTLADGTRIDRADLIQPCET